MDRTYMRNRSVSKNSSVSNVSSDRSNYLNDDRSRRIRRRSRIRSESQTSRDSMGSRASRGSRSHSGESVYRLHIGDIAETAKKADIERAFDGLEGLKEIWIAKSPPCFGFAVFKTKSNANVAIKATNGLVICGSRIKVSHAHPRTRGLGRRYFNPNMRCYECGMSGHFYRDCPDLGYNGDKYIKRRQANYNPNRRIIRRRYAPYSRYKRHDSGDRSSRSFGRRRH